MAIHRMPNPSNRKFSSPGEKLPSTIVSHGPAKIRGSGSTLEICKESNRLDRGRTEGRKVTRLKIDRIRYGAGRTGQSRSSRQENLITCYVAEGEYGGPMGWWLEGGTRRGCNNIERYRSLIRHAAREREIRSSSQTRTEFYPSSLLLFLSPSLSLYLRFSVSISLSSDLSSFLHFCHLFFLISLSLFLRCV